MCGCPTACMASNAVLLPVSSELPGLGSPTQTLPPTQPPLTSPHPKARTRPRTHPLVHIRALTRYARARARVCTAQFDEFGRLIDYTREKSASPARDRRKTFDPRTLRRSESPERDMVIEQPVEEPQQPQFVVDEDDDPETAAAKMEMQAMAMMGMPVDFNSSKGKGGKQSDKAAVAGGVRIKPQVLAVECMQGLWEAVGL